MRTYLPILICLWLVASGALDSANANPIVERAKAFTAAFNARDDAAVSSFYLDNAAVLPPRAKALVGRKKIAAHYARAFKDGVSALKYKILEIDQVGPAAAIEIGEAHVCAGARTLLSRSLRVWKKVDGTWFLYRDMYHVLAAAK